MNAKYVLLNHFSQRYPKLPRVQPIPSSERDVENKSNPKVALAFDLMTLPLRSFERVSGFTDAMEELFKEEEEEEGEAEATGKGKIEDTNGTNGKPKNGKTVKGLPQGKTGKDGSEMSNSQRRKLERKKLWDDKKASDASPVAGEKRQSAAEDDVDMERGTVKRTKSENMVVAQEVTAMAEDAPASQAAAVADPSA